MKEKLPPYITPSTRHGRRRQGQAGRRGFLWAFVVVVVAAVVVAWALILPGGDRRTSSTSTSAAPAPSSSTTSTTTRAATTTSTAAAEATGNLTYTAQLTGENEIPALSTPAGGVFTLTVAPDGSSVGYVLRVSAIADVSVARLRKGKAGATGAILLTVYGGPTMSGLFSGILTQDSFKASKLEGPLKGKTIADLEALVEAGSVYLNVGTSAHPKGEIRGQLKVAAGELPSQVGREVTSTRRLGICFKSMAKSVDAAAGDPTQATSPSGETAEDAADRLYPSAYARNLAGVDPRDVDLLRGAVRGPLQPVPADYDGKAYPARWVLPASSRTSVAACSRPCGRPDSEASCSWCP